LRVEKRFRNPDPAFPLRQRVIHRSHAHVRQEVGAGEYAYDRIKRIGDVFCDPGVTAELELVAQSTDDRLPYVALAWLLVASASTAWAAGRHRGTRAIL
jgi:hypothetical protein